MKKKLWLTNFWYYSGNSKISKTMSKFYFGNSTICPKLIDFILEIVKLVKNDYLL